MVAKLFLLALLVTGQHVSAFLRVLTPPRGLAKSTYVTSKARSCFQTSPLHALESDNNLVGEAAAEFSLDEQKLKSWGVFGAAVSAMLASLYLVWMYPGGPQLGDKWVEATVNAAGGDSTIAIVYMLGFFAVVHSGLASLRPAAEEIVGARSWRVIFAASSLPLAFSSIVYFINHRYDGAQLWDLTEYFSRAQIHDFVWWTSLVSFLFLYPSTFNLLEIAAVEKPRLHLWETGVTRITRHPQMVGQLMWCAAHTAYIGSSFMVATSTMLCAHHIFAVWNGDRRLKAEFGDKFDIIAERTSVWPFAAILSGKQQLPDNYVLGELVKVPYVTVVAGTLAAYYAHPFMQAGSTLIGY
jgi:zeta-carotene isomerase